MNNDLAAAILRSIAESGDSSTKINTVLCGNLSHILNLSSGAARIHNSITKKFSLILSQPELLKGISPLAVHCCLCRRVIGYPCWYYSIKYAVNHFHYFVCFDKESPNSVTASCYRKEWEK